MDNMEILIIRSTSNQHLALVVRRLLEKHPLGNIDILTHSHSAKSIAEMKNIRDIFSYPPSPYFSPFLIPSLSPKYHMVVVPVSNLTGSGYENVLLLALRIKKEKIFLCNLSGEFIPLPAKKIIARAFRYFLAIPIAVFGALLFLTLNLLLLVRVATLQWNQKLDIPHGNPRGLS